MLKKLSVFVFAAMIALVILLGIFFSLSSFGVYDLKSEYQRNTIIEVVPTHNPHYEPPATEPPATEPPAAEPPAAEPPAAEPPGEQPPQDGDSGYSMTQESSRLTLEASTNSTTNVASGIVTPTLANPYEPTATAAPDVVTDTPILPPDKDPPGDGHIFIYITIITIVGIIFVAILFK